MFTNTNFVLQKGSASLRLRFFCPIWKRKEILDGYGKL